ncbi:VOC family protein [Amycolatopsis sp. VS8301801F10]|uniref:VOC family protein n=1 Tax=unclassified Amycolatopsis TaxID=2618356 RepID=UPI0038FC152B
MSEITALGYLVVRGPVEEWKTFGAEVLGAQLAEGEDPSTAIFRTDDRAARLMVEDGAPGPDALVALGFEVRNDAELDALAARLGDRGIAVAEDPGLAETRRVRRLLKFADNAGNTIEACVGQEVSATPFVSPRGVRFVCGDLGVGHAFFFADDPASSASFYQEALGFRLSDTIAFGEDAGIFLHCNPRHHTVAFAAVPSVPAGLGHLMLEVRSLEDVGRALDLAERSPYPVQMSIGEHSNDKMTSFYVQTPSGFAVEYGFDGLLVDDATWKVAHHDAMSVWGHHLTPPDAEPRRLAAPEGGR